MYEILQIISLSIGIPTATIVLLTTVCKPFREWYFGRKKHNEKKAQEEENKRETDRCLLRNHIVSIYFRHNEEKKMREWEYENLVKLYEQYKKLDGNSFVDKIWEEVQSNWEVIR